MSTENLYVKEIEEGTPFWHLCTPGDSTAGVIFRNREDFVFGMNMMALCAHLHAEKVKVLTFQLMSNHVHILLQGESHHVTHFFSNLKTRLGRYLRAQDRYCDIKGFEATMHPIHNVTYLRNVLAYVNRNGFLVDQWETPFTYPWGANSFYFNRYTGIFNRTPLIEIPVRVKRKIFRTHECSFPQDHYMIRDYVSPECYCSIKQGESLFKNAHDYFQLISRQVESFADIARSFGDKLLYTDVQLNTAAIDMAKRLFDTAKLSILGKSQKLEMAKQLRFRYNASVGQIRRILNIDERILENMFPENVRK